MIHFKVDLRDSRDKKCRSIVRDESSVYFNVTAKHVWHLVATVYKPTVPCMIIIELSDIWLISEAIYHLIFTQDPLNWSLESPPQHRDDFVMPTFLYRVKKQPKMLTLVKICICATGGNGPLSASKKSQPSFGGTGKKLKCSLDLFHVQWNIFYINVVVTYIHNLLANTISQGAS